MRAPGVLLLLALMGLVSNVAFASADAEMGIGAGADPRIAAMKMPLPAGVWLVAQGDSRTEGCSGAAGDDRPTHCDGAWDICALDLAAAPGPGWSALNYPVLSAADGTVIQVGWHEQAGNYVMIEHGAGGPVSLYLHLSAVEVAEAAPLQTVVQGQVLGYAGATGAQAHGRHLHFAVLGSRESGRCLFLDGLDGNADLRRSSLVYSSNVVAGEVGTPALAQSPGEWAGIPVGVDFSNQTRLLGYDLARAGSQINLTLYWQSSAVAPTPYHVFVHVINPNMASVVAQRDYLVDPERWVVWNASEIRSETVVVDVSSVPPGNYMLGLGIYEDAALQRLNATYISGERVADDWVPLVRELEIGCGLAQCVTWHPVNVRFAGQLELDGVTLGYDFQSAGLSLHWRSYAYVQEAYRAFIHVVDDAGQLVAQFDREIGSGRPTSTWQQGEEAVDHVRLNLDSLPPGEYQVGVGVYEPVLGERLTATRVSGMQVLDNWVALPLQIKVERAG